MDVPKEQVAERLRRACDRFDTSRMSRPHSDLQRAPSAPRPVLVCRLLPTHPHASVARQGLPRIPPDPVTQARKSRRHPTGRRSASSLRTSRRLMPPEFLLTNGCAAVPRPQVDDLWMRSFNSRSEADHVDDQIAAGLQFASCSNLGSDGVFGRDRPAAPDHIPADG
jgi:hypothetical protein